MSRQLAAALLCGAALALCFPRPGLCALAWFALAPLIFEIARRPPRGAFALGWTAGFAFHGVAFYWIYSTCRFAMIPVPAAVLAWGAFSAFQGLLWGAIGFFGRYAAEALPERLRPWGWALVWTALSVACERWTPRMPGDLLSYTQWRHLTLLQMGAVFGPHGLGFIIVSCNAALAKAWAESDGGRRAAPLSAPNLAIAAALAAAAWAYGAGCLAARSTPATTARVEVLQPVVDQYEKWDETREKSIGRNFAELLALPRSESPALIVWPESALPRWINAGESPQEASAWSRKLAAAQLVGVVSRQAERHFNSIFLVGSGGAFAGAYHKRELVPFGEYVPFGWVRRYIGKLNELGGITPGARTQALLETPLGPAAMSICYEAVFPRWTRRDAKLGARLLVNVTNDGWYKHTWGPYQHFHANLFRAVENRMTVIRSGNTGISAVIDPWGVALAKLDLDKRGRLDAAVPLGAFPEGSFYRRHGDWFGLSCLALALMIAAAGPGLRHGRQG